MPVIWDGVWTYSSCMQRKTICTVNHCTISAIAEHQRQVGQDKCPAFKALVAYIFGGTCYDSDMIARKVDISQEE